MAWQDRELPKITTALPRFESWRRRRRSLSSGVTVLAVTLTCAACGGSPAVLTAFRTEQQAQEHCPSEAVVWVDAQSGTYQLKGHGSYGLSDGGRYACRGDAERAGMHTMTN
jgi:hypothetical protein